MTISSYMKNQHRECDIHFAKSEEEAAKSNWEAAIAAFETFADETLTHFKREEEELFPAFEGITGNAMGPTRVMRFEHEQVKGLIGKMAHALDDKDKDAFLSLSESMMILLQQHNMKEEQMLYAMCENLIPPELKEKTLEAMKQIVL